MGMIPNSPKVQHSFSLPFFISFSLKFQLLIFSLTCSKVYGTWRVYASFKNHCSYTWKSIQLIYLKCKLYLGFMKFMFSQSTHIFIHDITCCTKLIHYENDQTTMSYIAVTYHHDIHNTVSCRFFCQYGNSITLRVNVFIIHIYSRRPHFPL